MTKKKPKGSIWIIFLIATIATFAMFLLQVFQLESSIHMETLLDFFVVIAEIGIYAYFAAIWLVVSIVCLVITIVLAVKHI